MGVCQPEGPLRWIAINSEPVLGPDGRPSAVVTTFVDITERKRMEDALLEEKEMLRQIFENSGETIDGFEV